MPTIRIDDAPSGRFCQALRFGTALMALGAGARNTQARHLTHVEAGSNLPQPALVPAALDAFNTSVTPLPHSRLSLGHHRPPHEHAGMAGTRVSLVVPNFGRPDNVKRIAQRVADYHVVDETLIWDVHVDPAKKLTLDLPKTWVINTPETQPREKWGLMTRFKDCVLASNEWVLMTDDDQLLGEEDIIAMMKAKHQDPDRLVCYFGRDIGDGHTPEQAHYRFRDPPAPSQVPICLTKAVLTDRRFCLEALRRAPMMEDVARAGEPYWNGEDIWHALTAYHLTGKLHVLLPRNETTYKILPAPDGIGDARPGKFDHGKHRDNMVQQGVRRLGVNVSAMHVQPWEINA